MDNYMNSLPPPTLIETWIFIAQYQDFKHNSVQFHTRRKIKQYFGSIEMAKLYLEKYKDVDIEIYFI